MGLRGGQEAEFIAQDPIAPPSPGSSVLGGSGQWSTVQPGSGLLKKALPVEIDRRDLGVYATLGKTDARPGPRITPGYSLPSMVIQRTTRPGLLGPTFGGFPLQEKRRLPVARPPVPLPQVRSSPVVRSAGLPTRTIERSAKGDNGMSDDLGLLSSWPEIIGAAYNYFKPQPDFSGSGFAGTYNPPAVIPPESGGIGGGGIPNLPVFTDGGSCEPNDPMQGYVMKKVCGQWRWVKPKRRRRKVLLTEADYNGLLRIESLKVNKNMTIALGKALSR